MVSREARQRRKRWKILFRGKDDGEAKGGKYLEKVNIFLWRKGRTKNEKEEYNRRRKIFFHE